MFDANMRHLPKGHEFFAEMCGVRDGHPVRFCGVKSRLVLCKMLSENNENPTVRFYGDESNVDVTDSDSGIGSWFTYAGNKDGTGFIDEVKKKEAMAVLQINNGER